MKDEDNEVVSVDIPKKLFERIGETIGSTSFQTVSKYITYLLERELSSAEERVFSEEDKERIKKRLGKLGYW